MNSCFFTGRIVREPELRKTTQNGNYVANFAIAAEHYQKDQKIVEYPELVAWGKQAEFAAKLPKGTMLSVRAIMKTDSYTAKDGTKRKQVRFVVQELQSAFSAQQNGAESTSKAQNSPVQADNYPQIDDDDCALPF